MIITVTYTVTAQDSTTTQDCFITVTEAEEALNTDILTFVLPEQTGTALIDATNHTVAIEVAFGTNLTSLKPVLTFV